MGLFINHDDEVQVHNEMSQFRIVFVILPYKWVSDVNSCSSILTSVTTTLPNYLAKFCPNSDHTLGLLESGHVSEGPTEDALSALVPQSRNPCCHQDVAI